MGLKKMKNKAWALIKDESGQTTTEYVLLIVIVVVMVKSVGGVMKTKLEGLINSAFTRATNDAETP